MFHLVLLSAAIAKRTQLAERKLREEKDRVIAISRSAEQDLTVKVRERTADLARANAALTEEVDRRHLLELKLRQSLGSVNDALAQQRDFVALVSHEFRAPLTVIAAAAENLVHLAEVSAGEVAARANRILRTVRRMSMLIENVLAGDRLDETKSPIATKVAFDLNEILSTVADGLDDDAKKRVIFERGSAAIVIGDRYLLEIVLQNLVQNALKYSALTSPVRVRLSTHEGVGLVEVADLGGGVARQDRDRIFAKYFRAAGLQASGSGLGLYIAKGIARQHGGDLLLHASNKSGSTFRLTLPLAGAQTETFPLGSSQILNVPGTLSTGD
jgi:signal transduction histidine kinase